MRARVHVGTSGWTYGDWEGVFYPPGVRGPDRLAWYAQRFDTVEVNASFYRFPAETAVAAWNRRLPPGFHLVLKGHRRVTHVHRLGPGGDDVLAAFLARVAPLRRLRVLLWQLPPSLRCDPALLDGFLQRLAARCADLPRRRFRLRHAVEFRHPSWWEDPAVPALLRRHRAAFVAVDHPRLPREVFPTADFLYVRFHGSGPRLYDWDYSDTELRAWVRRLLPHLRRRPLYAFFNNDVAARAPRNALRFRRLLERALAAGGASR